MGKHELKIGVDLTGGDHPPETILQELLAMQVSFDPSLKLVFFATNELLSKFKKLCHSHPFKEQFLFVETEHLISMEDSPLSSLRLKKNSPSLVALRHMKSGDLDALVSISNSGALVAGSSLILKTIKGIRRPGLLAMLPTLKEPLVVIDVGASLHTSSSQLLQYAKMGIAFKQTLGVSHPRVGLLNIGSEKEKGRAEMKETYKKLTALSLQEKSTMTFIGNIEAKKAFFGSIDVLVTDGISGNIFLKTTEGVSAFIEEKLKEEHKENHFPLPRLLTHILNSAEYPGAIVCGVEGVVIKCHGDSRGKALYTGIQGAYDLLRRQFLKNLKKSLQPLGMG